MKSRSKSQPVDVERDSVLREMAKSIGKNAELTHRMLTRLGDNLARRHKYQSNDGVMAVRFHLMQKHDWLPSVVLSMSEDELAFAVSEDRPE